MSTVNEYIQSKPSQARTKLKELRQIINTALPDTTEAIKWHNPTVLASDGMILMMYAAYGDHLNLMVTVSTLQAMESKLENYTTGKVSIQFPLSKPLPVALIKQIVSHRADDYKDNHITYK